MFKKDDYIVILDIGDFRTHCALPNYCFKQKKDSDYITPEIDLVNHPNNSNSSLLFNKSDKLKDWRYATKSEIDIYESLGKPFDVTEITNPETPSYEIY